MALKPDPKTPGLWVNDGWQEGSPGTFAVVIGVSRYQHLPGGPQPTAGETYGLEQLEAAALTAFRFFEWLARRYDRDEAPLARIWLLLAPTAAEQAAAGNMPDTPEPTIDGCRVAVEQWFAAMQALLPQHAAGSRALFFFSGHGLEVETDQQILLPSDYLRPPGENVNEALSTENLCRGLRALAFGEQIFLLDACRNDNETLRELEVEGRPILKVKRSPSGLNPDAHQPLVLATAPGRMAWAPAGPATAASPAASPLSVFGQALLEGLEARAGMKAECDPPPCRIQLFPLFRFLKERVRAIHAERGSRADQKVQLSGTGIDDLVITRVVPPQRAPPRPPPPPPGPGGGLESFPMPPPMGGGGGAVAMPAPMPRPAPAPAPAPPVLRGDVEVVGDGRPATFGVLHDLFRSERMTGVWDAVRLLPVDDLARSQPQGALRILAVQPDEDHFRVTFRVEQLGAWWIELPHRGRLHACVLPGDLYHRPVYLAELARSQDDSTLERFEVGLSEETDFPPHAAAARLWHRYQRAELGDPVARADARALLGALESKLASPLAATVGGLVLHRTGAEKLPLDWLRNLASVDRTFDPALAQAPDGPVLLAAELVREVARRTKPGPGAPDSLRSADPQAAAEVERALAALALRGLPRTAEGLSHLSRLLRDLDGQLAPEGLPPALEELRRRTRTAVARFRPGGLLATFAAAAGKLDPGLVAAWSAGTAPPPATPAPPASNVGTMEAGG